MISQEQRRDILRGLPRNSPVKYTGRIEELTGKTGFKLYNGRGANAGYMAVSIAGGKRWFLPYKALTCKALEVYDRIHDTTKTPSK